MTARAKRIRCRLDRLGAYPLVAMVCWQYHVDFATLWSDDRHDPLPYVRGVIYGLMRRMLLWSYPQIGRVVERDPTNIMEAVQRHSPRDADIGWRLRDARRRRVKETVRESKAQNRRSA